MQGLDDIVRRKNIFLNADSDYATAKIVLIGVPMDWTVSYRPGSRFGPQGIRDVSEGLEEYSPYLKRSLAESSFYDAGNLILPFGNVVESLELISRVVRRVVEDGKVPFCLGGEHLISLSAVGEVARKYRDLVVLHFDAHADVRDTFFGEKLSHATVLRRIKEIGPGVDVFQFGIRSGEAEEFEYGQTVTTMYPIEVLGPLEEVIPKLDSRPVYVTIDIDVVDPAFAPGTGTPEPGGITAHNILRAVHMMNGLKIVGCDLVEVAPAYDQSRSTELLAAKLVREMLLVIP